MSDQPVPAWVKSAAYELACRRAATRFVKAGDGILDKARELAQQLQQQWQTHVATPTGMSGRGSGAALGGLIGAAGGGLAGMGINALTARQRQPGRSFLTGALLGGAMGGSAGALASDDPAATLGPDGNNPPPPPDRVDPDPPGLGRVLAETAALGGQAIHHWPAYTLPAGVAAADLAAWPIRNLPGGQFRLPFLGQRTLPGGMGSPWSGSVLSGGGWEASPNSRWLQFANTLSTSGPPVPPGALSATASAADRVAHAEAMAAFQQAVLHRNSNLLQVAQSQVGPGHRMPITGLPSSLQRRWFYPTAFGLAGLGHLGSVSAPQIFNPRPPNQQP